MEAAPDEQEELNVLFHAVQLGRTDIVKNAIASLRETRSAEELLAALSAIRPESGGTLLHVCSIAGHSDVIRALLNIGVDASVVATAGVYMGKSAYQTADPAVLPAFHVYLFEKIALGHDKVIENLLDGGISVDLRDASAIDDSTLHWACSFGNVSVALILLDRGCPVNILNSSGQTPLHLACKNGSREVIELLLSRGANALLVDTHGRVAAQMVPEKHKDVLELISASVSEHPLQHTIHLPQQEETDEMVSANIEPDLYSERSAQGAHTMDDEGPPASAPYLRPSLANVTSHLILWPPPQRQRMLPMGSAEGDNDTSCALTPEFGIVFSNFRPILISCCTEDKSGTDISCIAELCGLTQALRRFGLESVVLRSPATADVRFSVNSSLCAGHNRYSINVCPSFISVIGSDNEGLLYGAHTLVQIVQLHSEFGIIEAESAVKDPSRDDLEFDLNGFSVSEAIKHADVIRTLTVPCVCVEDWPDFPSRGITWSYDSAALTNTSVLHNMIAMLSRMRMNKLFLHVDCLDYSSTAQQTEMAFTARQRDNVLCGSRIHYIERLCRSYFIDVVPKVSVPCLDIEPSGSSHKRLNVDALRSFSSTIIHVDFYLESPQLCKSDHLGESRCALVTRSCRLAFKSIRAAGFSSVVVNCTSDVQRCVDPLAIAIHIGLIGVYGEIDSFVHSEMQHALSSQMFLREAELRCRVDFEQGKTLSLAPGFVDSALLCPLVLIKYKCFLHSGFSWNRDTVLDIIGHSADIHMLEEVINLLLFTEGNGSLLTAVPKEASEGENKKLHQQDKLSGNFNGLQKSGSSGSQQGFQSSLDAQNESSNGFYFWRKQASSDASAALASPAVGTTMTHSEFVMALLTCSGAIFESREPEPKSNFRQPLFEYSNSACGLNSPSYRKSPSSHSARAHLNSPHLHRSAGTSVDSLTFAESESLFWRFLGAKTCDEFVTCGHSRTCEKLSNGDADGYAPSKAQALEVLKYYRRALASVGWKLDRKKMAALRESGMSGDNISTRAQWGADMIANKTVRGRDGSTEEFIFENAFEGQSEMPFPSYKDAKTWGLMSASQPRQVQKRHNQPFPSTSEMDVTNLQLEIEEIYVVLHLVCTLCRAVILGYNAWEKCRAGLSDGELLKFSELIALLPTGSTSDIANALLEGIEYGMMLWNRRFERMSFTVRRAERFSKTDMGCSKMGPAIPGIGAFYWISQNLPQQVEDLFFNTLTVLQKSS